MGVLVVRDCFSIPTENWHRSILLFEHIAEFLSRQNVQLVMLKVSVVGAWSYCADPGLQTSFEICLKKMKKSFIVNIYVSK